MATCPHARQPNKMELTGPRLELGRDSDNAREYWVFIPGNAITSKNEIGRITTAAFDHN